MEKIFEIRGDTKKGHNNVGSNEWQQKVRDAISLRTTIKYGYLDVLKGENPTGQVRKDI